VDYPASKENLIMAVANMGADEDVRSSLTRLPPGDFQTPGDVCRTLAELPNPPSGQPFLVADGNQFLARALQDAMAEIELCDRALQKTGNPDIRQFAQKMIEDHRSMSRDIERLAAMRDDFDLPRHEDAEQSAANRDLSTLSGQDFDRKFIEHNIENHTRAIDTFRHYAEFLDDPDIRSFAERSIGILNEHGEMAKRISGTLHP
jgi:putative membrane protein